MPKTTKIQCLRIIINTMCNNGFMNGWFGDIDEDFRLEQLNNFIDLTISERKVWIENNKSNLIRYCRVPEWCLNKAIEVE